MEGYGENVVLIAIGRGPPLRQRVINVENRNAFAFCDLSVPSSTQ